jgi:hypothetical protein
MIIHAELILTIGLRINLACCGLRAARESARAGSL